jgi:hypothetical protein
MNRTSSKVLYLTIASLLMLVAAPMLTWASQGALQVYSSTPMGDVVVVKVANVSSSTESGLLFVTALVDGVPTTVVRSVSVKGSSAQYATVEFGGFVDIVITTQIMDDPNPI